MRHIKKITGTLIIAIATFLTANSQSDSVNIDTISDYNGWGWSEILVVKNNFITLAVIPAIGARVLQYDLGIDSFMISNPAFYGDLFHNPDGASPYDGSWGYGGYKTWPAPQDLWGWPPPPTLGWGNYNFEVFQTSKDSVVIWMKGQTEVKRTPDLRFDRYMTVYANSSRVKVVTILFNDHATNTQNWAVWDNTQTIVRHEDKTDYDNFSVYFPIESEDDVWHNSLGDVPEREFVLPGIYRVQFTENGGDDGKIFAIATDGWVCFTDERDKQTYAKVFEIVEGADYSDDGAMVHIYANPGAKYMEVEALGPLEDIGANGDSIIWIEDWYASATDGPFYYVGHEGIVKKHLGYDTLSENLSGEFSSFSKGEFRITYLDESEDVLGSGSVFATVPTEVISIDETVTLPENTKYIEIAAYNYSDNLIGVLDRLDIDNPFEPPPDSYEEISNNIDAIIYPVPAKDLVHVQFNEKVRSNYMVQIRSITGQALISETFLANQTAATISVNELKPGLYFVEISGTDFLVNKQIIIQ